MLLLFIVGDMLGGGIYTLVGKVGGEVGGAIWTAFAAAFVLAALTACAYAELVSKYPQAAGAALYTNRAFRTSVLHLHGRLRGDGVGDHVGEHAGERASPGTPWPCSSTSA